eukprot:1194598-Prorocentrum_minimum.AAC.4
MSNISVPCRTQSSCGASSKCTGRGSMEKRSPASVSRLAISISGPLLIQCWRFSIPEFWRFSIVGIIAFAHGEFETASVREISQPETIRR